MDKSVAAIGLVARDGPDGERRYLLRWSPHWRQWNLFGGHVEDDEDERGCLAREANEELGDGVRLSIAAKPRMRLAYDAVSKRTGKLTAYDVSVFDASLVDPDALPDLTSGIQNLWRTADEILIGQALGSDLVSFMTRKIVGQLEGVQAS